MSSPVSVNDRLRKRLGLATVVGIAVLMGAIEIRHARAMSSTVGVVGFALLPFLANCALLVGGYRLWAGRFEGSEVSRIAGWTVLGAAMIGLLATWLITHQVVQGLPFTHAFFVTVSNMSVGGAVGFLLGWYDVRGRRHRQAALEREAELRRQNDRLEEFASIISHDLRSPLTVAAGNVDLARTECECGGGRERLDAAAAALDRMDSIVESTLTLARNGRIIGEVEPVDLGPFAEDCWRAVETGGATLRIEGSSTVRADRERLRHLFENLFRNSVEHGSTGSRSEARGNSVEHGAAGSRTASGDPVEDGSGAWTVAADAGEPTVTVGTLPDGGDGGGFYVEDDGPGIPEDEHEAVFEPGHSTDDDGTGFGLAIVDRIAGAHGWNVAVVESESGGARFEVTGVDVEGDCGGGGSGDGSEDEGGGER